MVRVIKRGKEEKLNEGVRNEWIWSWIDREIDGRRIGDVIRKMEDKGKCYCDGCKKVINFGSRGWIAIADHVGRKGHKKKVRSSFDRSTTLAGEDCVSVRLTEMPFFLRCFFLQVIYSFFQQKYSKSPPPKFQNLGAA